MRAILVFTCFVALACAGCGDDETESNGGNGGTGASMGTGGTGNTSSGGECQRICESPCIDDVGLEESEVAECVQACEMDGFPLGDCLAETVALLECLEPLDCQPQGLNCLDQTLDFSNCFGVF
jgi:hypothetical protein